MESNLMSMSASERLTEVAEILAAGLMRLRARQSTSLSRAAGDGLLDCAGPQSGHAKSEVSGEWHG
jgi:hypothetical protein